MMFLCFFLVLLFEAELTESIPRWTKSDASRYAAAAYDAGYMRGYHKGQEVDPVSNPFILPWNVGIPRVSTKPGRRRESEPQRILDAFSAKLPARPRQPLISRNSRPRDIQRPVSTHPQPVGEKFPWEGGSIVVQSEENGEPITYILQPTGGDVPDIRGSAKQPSSPKPVGPTAEVFLIEEVGADGEKNYYMIEPVAEQDGLAIQEVASQVDLPEFILSPEKKGEQGRHWADPNFAAAKLLEELISMEKRISGDKGETGADPVYEETQLSPAKEAELTESIPDAAGPYPEPVETSSAKNKSKEDMFVLDGGRGPDGQRVLYVIEPVGESKPMVVTSTEQDASKVPSAGVALEANGRQGFRPVFQGQSSGQLSRSTLFDILNSAAAASRPRAPRRGKAALKIAEQGSRTFIIPRGNERPALVIENSGASKGKSVAPLSAPVRDVTPPVAPPRVVPSSRIVNFLLDGLIPRGSNWQVGETEKIARASSPSSPPRIHPKATTRAPRRPSPFIHQKECNFDANCWEVRAESAVFQAAMYDRVTGVTCRECLETCLIDQDARGPYACHSVVYDHNWMSCDLFAVTGQEGPHFVDYYAGRDYFKPTGKCIAEIVEQLNIEPSQESNVPEEVPETEPETVRGEQPVEEEPIVEDRLISTKLSIDEKPPPPAPEIETFEQLPPEEELERRENAESDVTFAGPCLAIVTNGEKQCPFGLRELTNGERRTCKNPIDCPIFRRK